VAGKLMKRLIPLLLLLTACGSTVQVGRGAGVQAGGGGLDGTGFEASGGSVDSANGAALGPAAGGVQVDANGSPIGGGSGGSTPVAGSVDPTISGPGVTDTEIYIGLIHDVSAGAVNKAAGVGAITSGDPQANDKAIIDDINNHGGLAGRKLVPVYADFDETSSQTFDQQFAAICQQFTQDDPRVFAVIDAGLVDSYRQCIANAGVVMLSTSLPTQGQAAFSKYPGLIEQGYPNVDRLAAYEVSALAEQQYFTPWNALTGQPAATGAVKVGVLTYNDAIFSSAVDNYLVPALRQLGYEPIVAKVAQINTAADYGAQGAAVKSAQLSFAANGVTHVIPFESNGGLSTLFLPTARSQGYFPRYGVSTASGSEALLEAGAADKSQMAGAVGFGWMPSVDLRAGDNPLDGPYSNDNRRYCIQVMNASGITFDSGNAEGIALNACSDLYLLKTALDATPAPINLPRFVAAAESLGTSYQRAGGVGEEFRPGRHDPSNVAYRWRYVDDCGCFRYEGPPLSVP